MATDIIAQGMAGSALQKTGVLERQVEALLEGMTYKGAVNYYNQLPSNAKVGDVYTVKYKGTSGTLADGTEYVWGRDNGTNGWIPLGKEGQIDYADLANKPYLNGYELAGSKTALELGLATTEDIQALDEKIDNIPSQKAFHSGWRTNSFNNLVADITADTTVHVGDIYIGPVYGGISGGMPFDGNAEVRVEVSTASKVLHCVITSSNVSPYHWECQVVGGHPYDWRSFLLDTATLAGMPLKNNITKQQLRNAVEDVDHRFVSETEKSTYSAKYDKPVGGIPKADLADGVKASLEKADTALQQHQDISGKLDKKPDGTNDLIVNNKVNVIYLPDDVLGRLSYQSTFNSALPAPTSANKGHYYIYNGQNELVLNPDGSAPSALGAIEAGDTLTEIKISPIDNVTVNGQQVSLDTYLSDYITKETMHGVSYAVLFADHDNDPSFSIQIFNAFDEETTFNFFTINVMKNGMPAAIYTPEAINDGGMQIPAGWSTFDGSSFTAFTTEQTIELQNSITVESTYIKEGFAPLNGTLFGVASQATPSANAITFNKGDWAVSNGVTWDKVDNSELVTSVNGQTGDVVLNDIEVIPFQDTTPLTSAQIAKAQAGKLAIFHNGRLYTSYYQSENLINFKYTTASHEISQSINVNNQVHIKEYHILLIISTGMLQDTGYVPVSAVGDNGVNFLSPTAVPDPEGKKIIKESVLAKTHEMMAQNYDAAQTYAVGDLVIYQNELYKCNTAITTAEEWTAAHWTKTDLASNNGNTEIDTVEDPDIDYLFVPEVKSISIEREEPITIIQGRSVSIPVNATPGNITLDDLQRTLETENEADGLATALSSGEEQLLVNIDTENLQDGVEDTVIVKSRNSNAASALDITVLSTEDEPIVPNMLKITNLETKEEQIVEENATDEIDLDLIGGFNRIIVEQINDTYDSLAIDQQLTFTQGAGYILNQQMNSFDVNNSVYQVKFIKQSDADMVAFFDGINSEQPSGDWAITLLTGSKTGAAADLIVAKKLDGHYQLVTVRNEGYGGTIWDDETGWCDFDNDENVISVGLDKITVINDIGNWNGNWIGIPRIRLVNVQNNINLGTVDERLVGYGSVLTFYAPDTYVANASGTLTSTVNGNLEVEINIKVKTLVKLIDYATYESIVFNENLSDEYFADLFVQIEQALQNEIPTFDGFSESEDTFLPVFIGVIRPGFGYPGFCSLRIKKFTEEVDQQEINKYELQFIYTSLNILAGEQREETFTIWSSDNGWNHDVVEDGVLNLANWGEVMIGIPAGYKMVSMGEAADMPALSMMGLWYEGWDSDPEMSIETKNAIKHFYENYIKLWNGLLVGADKAPAPESSKIVSITSDGYVIIRIAGGKKYFQDVDEYLYYGPINGVSARPNSSVTEIEAYWQSKPLSKPLKEEDWEAMPLKQFSRLYAKNDGVVSDMEFMSYMNCVNPYEEPISVTDHSGLFGVQYGEFVNSRPLIQVRLTDLDNALHDLMSMLGVNIDITIPTFVYASEPGYLKIKLDPSWKRESYIQSVINNTDVTYLNSRLGDQNIKIKDQVTNEYLYLRYYETNIGINNYKYWYFGNCAEDRIEQDSLIYLQQLNNGAIKAHFNGAYEDKFYWVDKYNMDLTNEKFEPIEPYDENAPATYVRIDEGSNVDEILFDPTVISTQEMDDWLGEFEYEESIYMLIGNSSENTFRAGLYPIDNQYVFDISLHYPSEDNLTASEIIYASTATIVNGVQLSAGWNKVDITYSDIALTSVVSTTVTLITTATVYQVDLLENATLVSEFDALNGSVIKYNPHLDNLKKAKVEQLVFDDEQIIPFMEQYEELDGATAFANRKPLFTIKGTCGLTDGPTLVASSIGENDVVYGVDFGNVQNTDTNSNLDAFLLAAGNSEHDQILFGSQGNFMFSRYEADGIGLLAAMTGEGADNVTVVYATQQGTLEGITFSAGFQNLVNGKFMFNQPYEMDLVNTDVTGWNGVLFNGLTVDDSITPSTTQKNVELEFYFDPNNDDEHLACIINTNEMATYLYKTSEGWNDAFCGVENELVVVGLEEILHSYAISQRGAGSTAVNVDLYLAEPITAKKNNCSIAKLANGLLFGKLPDESGPDVGDLTPFNDSGSQYINGYDFGNVENGQENPAIDSFLQNLEYDDGQATLVDCTDHSLYAINLNEYGISAYGLFDGMTTLYATGNFSFGGNGPSGQKGYNNLVDGKYYFDNADEVREINTDASGWNGVFVGAIEASGGNSGSEPSPSANLTPFSVGQTITGIDFGNVQNGYIEENPAYDFSTLDTFLEGLSYMQGAVATLVAENNAGYGLHAYNLSAMTGGTVQGYALLYMDSGMEGEIIYSTAAVPGGEDMPAIVRGFQNLTNGKYIGTDTITVDIVNDAQGWNGTLIGAVTE